MKSYWKKIIENNKSVWFNKKFLLSVFVGLIFVSISLVANYIAGNYATEKASGPVTDIILSNTPAFDVDGVFIYGSIILFFFVLYLCFEDPRRLPFILKSLAVFVLIRSAFVGMTHIGPFPEQIPFQLNRFLQKITFGGDLFFSGHTGIPFLMALIFWKNESLRILFLTVSAFFGAAVLLGHLHYSIDVFAAFFITYSIFHLSVYLFKKDYHLLLET